MKSILAILSALFAVSSAQAGSSPCTADQALWEADAFLKFKHKDDLVVQQAAHGEGTWLTGQIASQYSINFVAIPKDPKYADCCSTMGKVTIIVRDDKTCDLPEVREESSWTLPTDGKYDFMQMTQDVDKPAPY